jgi:hypothetical protein
MKLYSYVVVHDCGFAPNPFHGWCTLAACTPNHAGIKATRGDWIAGFTQAKCGHGLLYAMEVHEVLHFDDYHSDKRFAPKIPRNSRDWRDLCGDNLYFTAPSGEWDRVDSPFHLEPGLFQRDTKHPYVFVSKNFFYFGETVAKTPAQFESLIHRGRGCKCRHDPATVEKFLAWLQSTFEPGVAGEPRDATKSEALLHSHSTSNTGCHSTVKRRRQSGTICR